MEARFGNSSVPSPEHYCYPTRRAGGKRLISFAGRARTQLAQILEAVNACAVAVAPFKLQSVLADELDFAELEIVCAPEKRPRAPADGIRLPRIGAFMTLGSTIPWIGSGWKTAFKSPMLSGDLVKCGN